MKMESWAGAMLFALASTWGLSGCGGWDGKSSDGSTTPAVSQAQVAATTSNASPAPSTAGSAAVSGPTAASGAAAGELINCEASWKTYVSHHPVGLTTAYASSTATKSGTGEVISSTQSSYEEVVRVSDENHVVFVQTAVYEGLSAPAVTTKDFTKANYLLGRGKINGAFGNSELGSTGQITQKSTQTVTVPAGTFTTDFIRGTSGNLGLGDAHFQNWTLQDGSDIIVKTVIDTKSGVIGAEMTTTITNELTRLVRP